jgi:FAD/FMN-containing dehydrogenase
VDLTSAGTLSWGRTVRAVHSVQRPERREAAARMLRELDGAIALPHGCGRSYGDVAINPGGTLIDCRALDRFIAFDAATGVLTCEAGVRLADILAVICRPDGDGSGWFLPVSPGTRFVTLGGAIANDVHGKNHHRSGTIGCHILSIEIARSDGSRQVCSPDTNAELFAATIGGLGLTGVILSASLQMRRVSGLALETEDVHFGSLDEFFTLARESDATWEYTAAWVDCLAQGENLGRGVFSRARHATGVAAEPPSRDARYTIPFALPFGLVNGTSSRAFNELYRRRQVVRRTGSYEPVLYPLDAVGRWNLLYGPKGFYQFQCAIPTDAAAVSIREMLQETAIAGQGSPLAVLKMFGDIPSPGFLSFPMAGATLALDFPNRGASTIALLKRLEAIAIEGGGRIYPAKDSLMSPESFRRGFPALDRFLAFRDPALSSAFARRTFIAEEMLS